MESDEVVLLRVDGKTSDGDCACLCTGENKAARTWRKERVSGKGRCDDVSIVSVEYAKPKNKTVAKGVNCPRTNDVFPPISVSKCGDVELVEVEVDSVSGSTASRSRLHLTSGSSASTDVAAGTAESQVNEDYLVAVNLHQALNSESVTPSSSDLAKDGPISQDEELARSLQEKEYSMLRKTESQDVSFVTESKVIADMPGPSSALPSHPPSGSPPPSSLRVKEFKPSPMNEPNSKLHPLLRKHPTCWTECPNCPSDVVRKYHLIDLAADSAEWEVIAKPVIQAGFHVTRVRGSFVVECHYKYSFNYQDPFGLSAGWRIPDTVEPLY